MNSTVAIASPLQSAFLSVTLFVVTLPVYFAVNVDRNVTVVAVYSLSLFLMIMALVLYAGVTAGHIRVLVSIYTYLILLVAFQFSMVGLFSMSYDVERETVVALLSVKSLLAFGIGSGLLLLKVLQQGLGGGRQKSAPFDKALWALLGYSLVSFTLSGAALEPRLAYFIHSIGTLAITALLFRVYRVGEEELAEFAKIISAICGILLIVGLIIYNFYEIVWIGYLKVNVVQAAMGSRVFTGEDLPPWFNTGFEIGGQRYGLPRFVSLVGNPVTLGYMFCFAYIVSLFLRRPTAAVFFFGATILTASKGAVLLLLVTTFFYIVPIRRIWVLYMLDAAIISGAIGFTLLIASSANLHLQSFIFALVHQASTLSITSFLGYGLGTGGTMAAVAGYADAETTGGESAMGALLYQLGFLGTGLYVAIFLLYRHRITRRLQVEDKGLYRLAQGCATGLLINSIFQENLLNLTLYLPYLFLLGAAANSAQGVVRQPAVS